MIQIALLKCYLNDHLVDYAVTMATLARQDCSPDIPNPFEVSAKYIYQLLWGNLILLLIM